MGFTGAYTHRNTQTRAHAHIHIFPADRHAYLMCIHNKVTCDTPSPRAGGATVVPGRCPRTTWTLGRSLRGPGPPPKRPATTRPAHGAPQGGAWGGRGATVGGKKMNDCDGVSRTDSCTHRGRIKICDCLFNQSTLSLVLFHPWGTEGRSLA